MPEQNNLPVPHVAKPERMPRVSVGAGQVMPIVPTTIDEVLRVAQMCIKANIVPDSLAKENGARVPPDELVSKVVAVIMAGAEVGFGPMAALSNICLINQKRCIYGAGAVAMLQRVGVLESYKVERFGPQPQDIARLDKYSPDFGVRVILRRRGQAEPYVGEYTVAMAKRAGLWQHPKKKPWQTAPERMMQWRAFHQAATDGFSDALNGLSIAEVERDHRLLAAGPPRINQEETDYFLADASEIAALAAPSAEVEQ